MKRLTALALLLVTGLAVALTGCGDDGAVDAGNVPAGTSPAPFDQTTTQSGSQTGPPPDTTTGTTQTSTTPAKVPYKVFFLRGEAASLTPVRRTHTATPRVGTAALEDLLAGPTATEQASGMATAIPADTRLLGLVIAGGAATVDLSSEFESGGGSASMFARLGQVACTLDQFPTVGSVRFELDGEPVSVFSGEGIVLDKPVSCGDYQNLAGGGSDDDGGDGKPAIVVESPDPGDSIRSGAKVTGTANVFEANVSYLLVANETVYDKGFTTATCGTGCRGTFSFRLHFDVNEPIDATLVVHDDDAAGTGTPPHVVRVPVRLLPN